MLLITWDLKWFSGFAFVLVRDSKKKFQSVLTPAQF